MAFQVVASRGPRDGQRLIKATSQAIVNGDFLVRSTGGDIVPGTSSAVVGDFEGCATESVTTAQALGDVGALVPIKGDFVLADTTNNTSITHNYQRMILTNSQTVNNTGTDSAVGVVEQVAVVGAASDKKILCRILRF